MDDSTSIVGLITAVVGLATAMVSLVAALPGFAQFFAKKPVLAIPQKNAAG